MGVASNHTAAVDAAADGGPNPEFRRHPCGKRHIVTNSPNLIGAQPLPSAALAVPGPSRSILVRPPFYKIPVTPAARRRNSTESKFLARRRHHGNDGHGTPLGSCRVGRTYTFLTPSVFYSNLLAACRATGSSWTYGVG